MKVDNFVLLIISIVTLIVISLLTECNRGRLIELENKAIKEIVETFAELTQLKRLQAQAQAAEVAAQEAEARASDNIEEEEEEEGIEIEYTLTDRLLLAEASELRAIAEEKYQCLIAEFIVSEIVSNIGEDFSKEEKDTVVLETEAAVRTAILEASLDEDDRQAAAAAPPAPPAPPTLHTTQHHQRFHPSQQQQQRRSSSSNSRHFR